MPYPHTATEEMRDALREGRFATDRLYAHACAVQLIALEVVETGLIARFTGEPRSDRDIAHDAIEALRLRGRRRQWAEDLQRARSGSYAALDAKLTAMEADVRRVAA